MEMIMTDIFSSAKTKVSKVADDKKTKAKKNSVSMDSNLTAFVALDILEKMVKAHKESIAQSVSSQQMAHFVESGMKIGQQPESFIGETDEATATMICAKRSAASALTDEQIDVLEMMGLGSCMQVIEKQAAVDEVFMINPALFNDQKKMTAFSKALTKAGLAEIDGESILIKQEAVPATTAVIVSDDAIDNVFQIAKEKNWKASMISDVMNIIAVFKRSSCKMKNQNFENVIAAIKKVGINL